MPTSKPEHALDVVDIEIGHASQAQISGLAFRFHLRDGTKMTFALPDDQAMSFAVSIFRRLGEKHHPPGNA
jgi:hypothetical protein